MESRQSHPIARAIHQAAEGLEVPLFDSDELTYRLGRGIRARLSSKNTLLGSRRFLIDEGVEIPPHCAEAIEQCERRGHSLVLLAIDGNVAGAIQIRTVVRPEVVDAIRCLRDRKLSVVIISGDKSEPTRELAEQLSIDEYFSEVLPEEKGAIVEDLQKLGRKVCFVGDGVNDSIALRKAEVSISLAGASSVAIDAADIIFMEGDLSRIPDLFSVTDQLSRTSKTCITISVVSPLITAGGVFFLHVGVISSTLVHMIVLAGGPHTCNSMIFTHR